VTRRRIALISGLLIIAVAAVVAVWMVNRVQHGRQTRRSLQADVSRLRAEAERLRPHVTGAMQMDPRLHSMPDRQLRVGIPTSLARTLITTVVAGVPDHVTLQLGGFNVRRQGQVRRVVPLGDYDLNVRITRVTARLTTGTPDISFGGNRVSLAMPVRIASGTGSASIDFLWDGRTIGGAVCGDMDVKQLVTGSVTPKTYRLSGALELSTTDEAILVTPRFPRLRISVHVTPTQASWDVVQKLLDSKGGLCGFVLDRVDIRGALEELLAKGFEVRLPTERLRPVALPVGIASTLTVRGTPVTFGGTAGSLTITDEMIWLGANVTLAAPDLPELRKVQTPPLSPRGGS
jgi:hypothetical protein